jgi:hypothetical protein
VKSGVRRRVLVSLPILALSLAGCGTSEQTQTWYAPTDGAQVEAGDIGIRNVVVVSGGQGAATVLASFANRGEPDQLVEVTVDGVPAEPEGGRLDLPADGYAAVGPDDVRVDLTGLEVEPGTFIEVEFRFDRAPRTAVDAVVQAPEGIYEDALPSSPAPDES